SSVSSAAAWGLPSKGTVQQETGDKIRSCGPAATERELRRNVSRGNGGPRAGLLLESIIALCFQTIAVAHKRRQGCQYFRQRILAAIFAPRLQDPPEFRSRPRPW